MLDLYSLKPQVDDMVAHRAAGPGDLESRLTRALHELGRWGEQREETGTECWRDLAARVAGSGRGWLLAGVLEPLDRAAGTPAAPRRLSVAATDGSQIFPDRHEISPCYLINVGHVLLHYGTGERPVMTSTPRLYYKEADLIHIYGDRRVTVNRDIVGLKRGLLELTDLAQLAAGSQDQGHETVALCDGSLIAWELEGRPRAFRQAYLDEMVSNLDGLRQRRIPLIGYISRPGSDEVVNALRIGLCPDPKAAVCGCGEAADSSSGASSSSCAQIAGVSDALLMGRFLKPGERSAVFASRSPILDEYGDHGVRFFYLHTGSEVVRIEIPAWVAADSAQLALAHASVWDQVGKGAGYPVGLTEAHERAVVRGRDRQAFFRFLQESMVKRGLRVSVSKKGQSKLQARV